MSNLIKKTKKLKLGDEEYIMFFDMKSIAVFQELAGMPFLLAIHLINKYDDKAIMYFMASSIRPINDPDEPIGEKLFEFDIMGLLLCHTLDVIELVSKSMPQDTSNSKKKVQEKKN
ncbi:MAG: hypothetical protein HUJ88_11510 [Fusobacterium necrophorum]|nr:hypothetical protein [Fusobacterium necrophorum]